MLVGSSAGDGELSAGAEGKRPVVRDGAGCVASGGLPVRTTVDCDGAEAGEAGAYPTDRSLRGALGKLQCIGPASAIDQAVEAGAGRRLRRSFPSPNCTAVPELPMILPLLISVLFWVPPKSAKTTPTPLALVPAIVPALVTVPAEP